MNSEKALLSTIKHSGFLRCGMLTSDHMLRFMNLVPYLHMQDPLFLQTLHYVQPNSNNREFVQILFSGPLEDGHWICV